MTYIYELQVPDLSLTVRLINFEINKGVFGKGSSARLTVLWDDVKDVPVGAKIKIYLMDKWVFTGYVKNIMRKAAVADISAVGEEQIFYKKYERKIIYPSDVGETTSMDVAEVVKYIVENYSDIAHTYTDANGNTVDTIQTTGTTITKFIINEYLANALDRLARAVGYVWYVKDGLFYFEEPKYTETNVTLDNTNTIFGKWQELTDKLVNDLHLIGAQQEYARSDYFRGDGTTTEFKLSYIPSGSVRVFINGYEQDADTYDINYDVPSIIFKTAPPAYNPSGDALVTAYPDWTYRRKITITIDSSATPSSIDSPTFIFKWYDLDWTNFNSDYSDVRFAVINDDNSVTEYPGGYIFTKGVYENNEWHYYRVFGVKLSGKTVNAGDTIEIYMLYGNSEAGAKYNISDFDGGQYTVSPSAVYNCCTDCSDSSTCSGGGTATLNTTTGDGYTKYCVTLPATTNCTTGSACPNVTVKITPSNTWITLLVHGYDSVERKYIDTDGSDVYLSSNDCVYVYLVGSSNDFNTQTITIGDRENNASYNIEVRYSFRAPIYVRLQDLNSQEKYGVYAKVIRANWISSYDMANLMAQKYITQYSSPQYQNDVQTQLKLVLDWGIYAGCMVSVNDTIQNMSGDFVIYKLKYTPKLCTLTLGGATYDIFAWGAKVEERIRQLETTGDENFFTP